jgi:RNA polymerase sigma factor (sigma-70 family)
MWDDRATEWYGFAVAYFRKYARLWTQDPYLLDLFWDGAIDSVIGAVAKFDWNRGTDFQSYLTRCIRRKWYGLMRANVLQKRDRRRLEPLRCWKPNASSKVKVRAWDDWGSNEPKTPAPKIEEHAEVHGREILELKVSRLKPHTRDTLLLWLNGATINDIAAMRGVRRQAVEQVVKRGVAVLRILSNV